MLGEVGLLEGTLVGMFVAKYQVPQLQPMVATCVPVILEYVANIPLTVTNDPVTAPTPPPATQPEAAVDKAIQEP